MKKLILFISIILGAGALLANVYNSVVDARSWGADIPNSIQTARAYFRAVNPGEFYRLFSPANQVFALLALIFFWRTTKKVRIYLTLAFVIYVLVDVMTFGYFYPRNGIMFTAPLTQIDEITTAWSEWNFMNWIRSLIIFIGVCFSFLGLNEYYKTVGVK